MALERISLSVADARDLAEGALRGIGFDDNEARIIADHVVDAALCGYEYSGLAKILNLPESERFKLPRRPMKVLRETDVSIAFDGGNNVGMLSLFYAAEATIRKATAHGIALVSVTDAWMSGRSAYYVEMIANAGLVAIHTAASSRLVAPPGGARDLIVAFAGSRPATAERAQISGRPLKSGKYLQRSTPTSADSYTASLSHNFRNRDAHNQPQRSRHSNPHNARRTTNVSLPAVSLYGAFFVKEFARAANLLSFVSFFVRSQSPFLRPDPRFADVVVRRSCQGWPSRQPCGMLRACQAIP
jgi:Malate/L-lactate dehydrogenase